MVPGEHALGKPALKEIYGNLKGEVTVLSKS